MAQTVKKIYRFAKIAGREIRRLVWLLWLSRRLAFPDAAAVLAPFRMRLIPANGRELKEAIPCNGFIAVTKTKTISC
jgi:hypothetical protein